MTATPWLDLDALCSMERRFEIERTVDALESAHGALQPHIDRAHELLEAIERSRTGTLDYLDQIAAYDEGSRVAAIDGLTRFVDSVTGGRRLHLALALLSEAADPDAGSPS